MNTFDFRLNLPSAAEILKQADTFRNIGILIIAVLSSRRDKDESVTNAVDRIIIMKSM